VGAIRVLPTQLDQAAKDAIALLEEAAGMGFEAVVIVGLKGTTVHTRKSKSMHTLALLGALELAKNSIVASWEST